MNKPVEDPKVNEPELQTAVPDASVPELSEPVLDIPTMTVDPPIDQANDDSLNPDASSPVKTANTQDDDVEITNTGFTELGRPTVLAKHSAKEEHVEPRNVRFDVTNYAQLGVGEIYSGFLSQVHSNRDLEVDMVKQMHHKFEV